MFRLHPSLFDQTFKRTMMTRKELKQFRYLREFFEPGLDNVELVLNGYKVGNELLPMAKDADGIEWVIYDAAEQGYFKTFDFMFDVFYKAYKKYNERSFLVKYMNILEFSLIYAIEMDKSSTVSLICSTIMRTRREILNAISEELATMRRTLDFHARMTSDIDAQKAFKDAKIKYEKELRANNYPPDMIDALKVAVGRNNLNIIKTLLTHVNPDACILKYAAQYCTPVVFRALCTQDSVKYLKNKEFSFILFTIALEAKNYALAEHLETMMRTSERPSLVENSYKMWQSYSLKAIRSIAS